MLNAKMDAYLASDAFDTVVTAKLNEFLDEKMAGKALKIMGPVNNRSRKHRLFGTQSICFDLRCVLRPARAGMLCAPSTSRV